MALARFDPLHELDRLADRTAVGARTTRTLPVEALRRGGQFFVALDVPGMQAGDIEVTTERNVIEIIGRRRPVRQDSDQVIVDERPQGEFRRQLFLGANLDLNKTAAFCEQGVLTLTIPVAEDSKPRNVEIGNSNHGQQVIPIKPKTPQTVNA
ncbi:MAG: Hsp20 family protein [Mycobacterium sp.]